MIAFLAGSVVVLAVVAVAAVVYVSKETVGKVLAEFSEAERSHRLERAAIMRAVVARSGGELAMLDRVAGSAEQKRTGTVGGEPNRSISQEEWQAMLRADMEKGLGGIENPFVPAVPEGL